MALDTFSKRLRAYRKLKSMTQQEFAVSVGVSVAIAGGWERGTRLPTEAELQRINAVLCVKTHELGLVETKEGSAWTAQSLQRSNPRP